MTAPQGGAPQGQGLGTGSVPDEVLSQFAGKHGAGSGQGATSGLSPQQMAQMQQAQGGSAPQPPSEVGTVREEIGKFGTQLTDELKQFFSLNYWLGIDPNGSMSPEDQAKARQVHSRYQQLDQEQQQVARQLYQEKMQKQRMREQEEQRRRQRDAQQNQGFSMPSGPQKGPVGPSGNKKQQAAQRVQKSRTTNDSTQGE